MDAVVFGLSSPVRRCGFYKSSTTRSIDSRSVVDEGLTPGEQVITAGQFKVQPGTLVTTAVASSDQAQTRVVRE